MLAAAWGCGQRGTEHANIASCPAGMARVEGGARLGASTVSVDPFCMDVTEVTVAAYASCVRLSRCSPASTTAFWVDIPDADRARWSPACNADRSDRQDHPANCVEWSQADAYCRAQGKRLPSADEWEWAARGASRGWRHPWGAARPTSQLCWSGVTHRDSTCAVASFPQGDAPGGIHDLAGNVWELTSTATADAGRIAMGGGYNVDAESLVDVSVRIPGEIGFRGPNTGFRCVR
jgi:formylglycine-generating enzyme required for sulfatase activity